MKHLDLREGWIRQMKEEQRVHFVKIDGKLNLADFFTKILPAGEHQEYASQMTEILQPRGMDVDVIGAPAEELN